MHPLMVLFAGVLSTLFLGGCCVCGGAMWWFRPVINEDPNLAHELLPQIVDIQIPDAYQPHGTIEWNVAFMLDVRGVYFERFIGDGTLTIVEVNSRFHGDDDVRRHIRQTLLEKGGGGAPLVIDDSETQRVEFPIRGMQVPFTIEIGRDPPTGTAFYILEGAFPGDQGEVLLSVRVDEDHWEEKTIFDMIRSISAPKVVAPEETGSETP